MSRDKEVSQKHDTDRSAEASGSTAVSFADDDSTKTDDENRNLDDNEVDEDDEKKDPLAWLPLEGTAKQVANWIAVLLGIWLLLNGVGMIGDGFKMIAGDQAQELFSFAENPFVGLAIGIVTTAIIQSSSTTTSIVVGMICLLYTSPSPRD